MQTLFREESGTVISPHPLRISCFGRPRGLGPTGAPQEWSLPSRHPSREGARELRGYVSIETRDALRLGQADDAVSSARRTGQRNSACGAPRREARRYESEEDLAGEKELTAESAKNAERENGDWDVLTAEMKRYEYVISPSGGISYNAPSGYHDDCVIALALANWRRWESESVGSMMRVGCDLPRRGLRRRPLTARQLVW
jgi:hypothetical protein